MFLVAVGSVAVMRDRCKPRGAPVETGLVCNEAQLKHIAATPHYAVFLDRVRFQNYSVALPVHCLQYILGAGASTCMLRARRAIDIRANLLFCQRVQRAGDACVH